MAVYKVPQDVEADDKLLGPFSFRQFVYLMITAGAVAIGVFLFKVTPPLAIIVLPIVLFFAVLALPLRKDQPMELYLAAILSFHLKPRQHLWDSDGIETLVEITVPETAEASLIKDVSEDEAGRRLQYLSQLSDSRGWSIRGVADAPLNQSVYAEANDVPDMLDAAADSRNFTDLISKSDKDRRSNIVDQLNQAIANPDPPSSNQAPATTQAPAAITPASSSFVEPESAQPVSSNAPGSPAAEIDALLKEATPDKVNSQPAEPTNQVVPAFDPYPASINQSVIQPLSANSQPVEATAPPVEPSETVPSADILRLANDSEDLTVAEIANEANRLKERAESAGEIYISLR